MCPWVGPPTPDRRLSWPGTTSSWWGLFILIYVCLEPHILTSDLILIFLGFVIIFCKFKHRNVDFLLIHIFFLSTQTVANNSVLFWFCSSLYRGEEIIFCWGLKFMYITWSIITNLRCNIIFRLVLTPVYVQSTVFPATADSYIFEMLWVSDDADKTSLAA